jgi:hypothetical protein
MGTEIKRMQERMNGTESVSVGELCEIRWQAAIMYAQKSYKARSEKNGAIADYNKTLSLGTASNVWYAMGFTENEVTEHKVIFTNTILSKGGTHASITDYFSELIKGNKMYPRAGQQTGDKPI